MLAIEKRGGIAIVQDPTDALIPNMPKSAMEANSFLTTQRVRNLRSEEITIYRYGVKAIANDLQVKPQGVRTDTEIAIAQ